MKSEFRFPVSSGILQIEPHAPGKPEDELMRELGLSRLIRMASNENCLGPSPRAVQAIRESVKKVNRYPDGDGTYLREALSMKLQVPMSQIILGNGSTDLVEIIARTYLQAEENSVTAAQTFLMYRVATLSMNAQCIEVPTKNYEYDMDGLLNTINAKTRLIYIANPNNPTGTMIRKSQMDTFLKAVPERILVVLDEAYLEYADGEDFPQGIYYLKQYPNVIVLRTFSKVYGLAGIRIGYAIACEEVIANLNRVRSPFNTSTLAQIAATVALQDGNYVEKSKRFNERERAFLEEGLASMHVSFVPSVTNFVLLLFENSRRISEKLLQHGIIVRSMHAFHVPEGLRVTVGLHEENVAFLEALKKSL